MIGFQTQTGLPPFSPQGGLCFSGFSDSLGQLSPGSLIRGHILSDTWPVGINLRMKVKQTYPSTHLPTHPSIVYHTDKIDETLSPDFHFSYLHDFGFLPHVQALKIL